MAGLPKSKAPFRRGRVKPPARMAPLRKPRKKQPFCNDDSFGPAVRGDEG
jgi:hypothetical protein